MRTLTTFASRREASEAAATALTSALRQQLAQQASAAMVVSGGSTPLECFDLLSKQPIDWERVLVTLSDERCVAKDHTDRNERMIDKNLLVGRAAAATYQSLELPLQEPFAAVLLGMGSDGHFASLFPDAENLDAALDLDQPDLTIGISTAASPHPRISMPLARLLRTECLILLAFGDDKRALIDEPNGTPLRALFEQSITPVQVFWAK